MLRQLQFQLPILIMTHIVSALPHFDPIPLDTCKAHAALVHKTQLLDTHQNELIREDQDNFSLMNGDLTKWGKWCKNSVIKCSDPWWEFFPQDFYAAAFTLRKCHPSLCPLEDRMVTSKQYSRMQVIMNVKGLSLLPWLSQRKSEAISPSAGRTGHRKFYISD